MILSVPASSANVGVGFDTLGIALNLHNKFELSLNDSDITLGEMDGVDSALHLSCLEMVQAAANYFFQNSKTPSCGFHLRCESHIPIARGLASSATFRLAIFEGLNRLLQAGVRDVDLVKWCAQLEGCADNVVASYFGGMTASGIIADRLVYYRFDLPKSLDFIAVSPSMAVETDRARVVFPETMPRTKAIHTLNRGILLTLAFSQGDFYKISELFDDCIHQPYRQANIPALKPLYDVIDAATAAGAIGAYLSGSGSTMMAITHQNREQIAHAMTQAITSHGMESEVRFLKADNRGLVVCG